LRLKYELAADWWCHRVEQAFRPAAVLKKKPALAAEVVSNFLDLKQAFLIEGICRDKVGCIRGSSTMGNCQTSPQRLKPN
jgi:hypothetical protein